MSTIVIVGAGIAGLSTYLQLRKHLPSSFEYSVTILERHAIPSTQDESASTLGGGLGISPNGMRILRRLNPAIHAEVERTGMRCTTFDLRTCGARCLGAGWAGSTHPTTEATVMIDRKSFWSVLRRHVPDNVVREGCRVLEVSGDGLVKLDGGETLKADLIIGADGLRSIVRRCVLDGDEEGIEPVFQ